MKVEGVVEGVRQREKGYSLKLGGEWFSDFGHADVGEGEEVRLEYSLGKPDNYGKPYKNITFLTKVGGKAEPHEQSTLKEGKTFPPFADNSTRIMRQAVLNTSSRIHEISLKSAELSVEELMESVKKIAEKLEEWVVR